MVVTYSTNLNKTNNHISPQLISEHKKGGTMTYDVVNTGPGLEQTQTCGGVFVLFFAITQKHAQTK